VRSGYDAPMRILAIAAMLVLGLAFTTEPQTVTTPTCGQLGSDHMRTTLYFGLSHPSGSISETQWRIFLRDEVTPRFPDGLTVWEANGQWRRSDGRIGRERAKVLLLVHEESPDVRKAIASIVARYKQSFHQESVLWETAPVCAAF
jgi:hypothetical protein